MSLRPRSGEQVSSLGEQIARAANPGGTTATWVRDRVDRRWCDGDPATGVRIGVWSEMSKKPGSRRSTGKQLSRRREPMFLVFFESDACRCTVTSP
ncbi:hypothetical protein E6R61_35660 [Streptomyces sp. LRa12]|nr:hypothetical protein E6R61_35660 [Streptomyces sp. LRa12]